MKRDLDLVRTILLAVEEAPAGTTIPNTRIEIPGSDPIIVSEHIQLLEAAGLLEATISGEIGPKGPRTCYIRGLTWQGHDYLDAVRNVEIWAKTKTALLKVGGTAGFEIIKQLASAIIKQQLGIT
jgi:Hypothetical protein (DUF2513)